MNREKSLSGLLQRWIEPKGGHASRPYIALIKASWSPLFTIVERRINLHPLSDQNTDFYDRIATYEGLEAHSKAESVTTPQIVGDIQRICEGMVQHVRKVSGGNVDITRIIVYFRLDERDNLWLLYCGGVQIFDLEEEVSKGPERELELSLPLEAISKHMPAGGHYHEMAVNRLPCFSCNLLIRQESLYPLSYRLILSCLENGFDSPPNCSELSSETLLEISEERQADEVPGLIRRAVEGVTNEKYKALKENMKWLQSSLKLCESCYLYYTAHVLREAKPTKPIIPKVKFPPAPLPPSELPLSPPLRTTSSWSYKRTVTTSKLLLSTSRSKKQAEIAVQSTPKLQGHFTAKRLPSLLSIYSLSETSTQSGSQSVRVRTREQKSDVVKSTIQQLKRCILEGI